jgi:predicted transcriptional regulator
MPRMSVELPDDINELITRIAQEQGVSKTEVIRRAFAVLKVAEEEKANGGMLGMVRRTDDGKLEAVARLIGV